MPQQAFRGKLRLGGWGGGGLDLQHGVCGTASQGHDCLKGTKGSWTSCAISNISQSSTAIARPHEVSLQTACHRACLECPRCKYISFSEQWGDCSWFHVCDLSQLRSDVPGFHTLQVRGMGGRQRAGPFATIEPFSKSPPRSASAVKLRVLVAFSGGLNRGVQLTGPSLFANVLSPMRRAGWAVTVFCSGLAPAALLDGVRSCNAAKRLLRCDHYEVENETAVHAAVAKHCGEGLRDCRFKHGLFFGRAGVRPAMWRALTQLYFEQRVADFLLLQGARTRTYDVAIACSPDYFAMQPLSLRDVRRAAESEAPLVLTTNVNLGLHHVGYTNGFYIGKPEHVAAIAGRFWSFAEVSNGEVAIDYEHHLKMAFRHRGVRNDWTAFEFIKVRANCKLSWQRWPSNTNVCNFARVQMAGEHPLISPNISEAAWDIVPNFWAATHEYFLNMVGLLRKHTESGGSCSCPIDQQSEDPNALFRSVRAPLNALKAELLSHQPTLSERILLYRSDDLDAL